MRYPSPARASPATSVDLPDPEAPGTSTPVPPASSAPAWNSRCSPLASAAERFTSQTTQPTASPWPIARRASRSPSRQTSTVPARSDEVSEYQWLDGCGCRPGSRSPARTASARSAQALIVGAHRERYDKPAQARRAVRPLARTTTVAQAESPALPASCASVGPSAAGLGGRLAQCCMAHPPATSAAPISASRWMSRPGEGERVRCRVTAARDPVGAARAGDRARCRGAAVPVVPALRGHAAACAVPLLPALAAGERGTRRRLGGEDLGHHPGGRTGAGHRGHAPEGLAPREAGAASGRTEMPLRLSVRCSLCMSTADPDSLLASDPCASVCRQWVRDFNLRCRTPGDATGLLQCLGNGRHGVYYRTAAEFCNDGDSAAVPPGGGRMRARPPRSARAMAASTSRRVPHHARLRPAGDGTARPRGRRRRAEAVTEQTARLLWEACRRDPDPAAVRRALAGGADTARAVTAASEHRIGPLLWRALGAAGCLDALGPDRAVLGAMADAFRMEALLLLPRAVALAVRPADRGRARTGRVQGAGGGRPLPRARAAARWRTSTSCSPGPTTGARSTPCAGPGGRWPAPAAATVRHRADPPRGALAVPRAALRARGRSQRVTALDPERLWARASAARVRGHAGLRAAAGRGARRAGRPRRQAAPRLRAAGVDRRPGHDRRATPPGTARRSTGTACAPWPGPAGA